MCVMSDDVNVRELRQNLSVHLRLVKAGRTLKVLERGRPGGASHAACRDTAARWSGSSRPDARRLRGSSSPSCLLREAATGSLTASEAAPPPARRAVKAELVYLDSSALVKLVVQETRERRPRAWTALHPATVTVRARRDGGAAGGGSPHAPPRPLRPRAPRAGRRRAARDSTRTFSRRPRSLAPREFRTLDAIHIASALSLGTDLLAFVTYDDRQTAAARKAGLPLVQPRA